MYIIRIIFNNNTLVFPHSQVIFGFLVMLKVQNELFLGLLFLSCIPGGGLGYLLVSITGDTDAELSIILNFLQMLLPLGKSLCIWW